jgi:hypothetical protein
MPMHTFLSSSSRWLLSNVFFVGVVAFSSVVSSRSVCDLPFSFFFFFFYFCWRATGLCY